MKTLYAVLGAALTLSAVSSSVVAAESPQFRQGAYVGISAGAQFVNDSDASTAGITAPDVLTFDTGVNAGAQVGYKFGTGFRVEESLTYSRSEAGASGNIAGIQGSLGATLHSTSLMTNAYYDFNTQTAITPYVGAGIGISFLNVDYRASGTVGGVPVSGSGHASDSVFTYAAMAGANYALTDKISVGLEYRFTGSEDPSFANVGFENESHNVDLKVSYSF